MSDIAKTNGKFNRAIVWLVVKMLFLLVIVPLVIRFFFCGIVKSIQMLLVLPLPEMRLVELCSKRVCPMETRAVLEISQVLLIAFTVTYVNFYTLSAQHVMTGDLLCSFC